MSPNPSFIFPPQAYDGKVRFDVWQTQLEMYLKACEITDGSKKALALLQHIGLDMLSKIIDWVSPDKAEEKTYDQLITLLKEQYSVTPNLFSLRVKLFNEKQPVGQSVQEYISDMHQLLGKCALKDVSPEEYGVLAIIRGLESDELRQYLLNPGNTLKTIKDLRDLAVSYEQSRVAAKEVACRADKPFSVNFAGKSSRCKFCGGIHQRGRDYCPAKDKICSNCSKKDHFASVCKSDKQNVLIETRSDGGHKLNGLYPQSVLTVSSEHEDYVPPSKVHAKLNGIDVDFQHDSGAGVTVICKKVWNMIGKPKLYASELKLKSYNKMIPVIGQSKIIVQLGKQIKQLWVTVVPQGASLFGRSWMKAFQIGLYAPLKQRSKQAVKTGIQKLNTVTVFHSSSKLRESETNSNWRKRESKADKVHAPMQGKVKDSCQQNESCLLSTGFPKSSIPYSQNSNAQANQNFDRRCKDRVESKSKKLKSLDERVRLDFKCKTYKSKKHHEQSEDHSLGEDDETCAIEIYQNGQIEKLKNTFENEWTPLYFSMAQPTPEIGEKAQIHLHKFREHVLYDIFKIIGKPMNEITRDPEWRFKIVEENVIKCFQIETQKGPRLYPETSIIAAFLKSMKLQTENYLNFEIKEIYLCSNFVFTDPQKRIFKNAASKLDLKILSFYVDDLE